MTKLQVKVVGKDVNIIKTLNIRKGCNGTHSMMRLRRIFSKYRHSRNDPTVQIQITHL